MCLALKSSWVKTYDALRRMCGKGDGSQASNGDDQVLPLEKEPRRSSDPHDYMKSGDQGKRRRSVEIMSEHLEGLERMTGAEAGPPVTWLNARRNLLVVRGPDWRWDDEDGGAGQVGTILAVNEGNGTVAVHWHKSGLTRDCYKLEGSGDLCVAPQTLQQVGSPAPSRQRSKPNAAEGLAEEAEEDDFGELPNGKMRSGGSHGSNRRNSQAAFSSKSQTVIILDWDDTLFPSSYLRGDIHIPLRMPLAQQNISKETRQKVSAHLDRVAARAEQVLRLAWQLSGRVIVVTLARSPWVTDSSSFFFPKLAELIKELDIKVVYAQGVGGQRPIPPPRMTDEQLEEFWSKVKGEAIGREVREFYTQYDGQSWKNIISIGDSEFERLGTMRAVEEYMRNQGIADVKVPSPSRSRSENPSPKAEGSKAHQAEIHGHLYRVRIKTFKMVDQPTAGELVAQLDMLRQWLPLMVSLDDGFDVEFSSLNDLKQIQAIDNILRGGHLEEGHLKATPEGKVMT